MAVVVGLAAAGEAWLLWTWFDRRRRARRVVPGSRRTRGTWRARAGRCVWRGRQPVDHAVLLDDVARRVRAGESLAQALSDVCRSDASVPDPLRAAVARHGRGVALADACRPVADEPDRSLALVGATICALARFGGAGGRALDAAAAALRDRAAVADDVRAQAATARLSALVLVALPVGLAGWTVTSDRAARAFLLGSRLGWAVTAAGVGLDAVGALWMRRLVAGAMRA